jgi:hypothetical protein
MKMFFTILTSVVMIVFTLYRGFTTIIFLPFVASFRNHIWIYFLLLVLIAFVTTVLSFTRYRGMSALLCLVIALMALSSWMFDIHNNPVRIWLDFLWFVLPEACFSLAGICKWRAQVPGSELTH